MSNSFETFELLPVGGYLNSCWNSPWIVVPADEMYRMLNYKREPTFEAVATTGIGVFDTLKSVAKQILIELKKR